MRKIRLGFLMIILVLTLAACGTNTNDKKAPNESQETIEKDEDVVEDTVNEPQVSPENKNTVESIVQIQTDTHMGSGVLWSKQEDEWLFVTAAHVVGEKKEVEIYFVPEDKMCSATVQVVTGLDLAFLSVETNVLTAEIMDTYQEVMKSTVLPEVNSDIISKGYNASAEFMNYEGSLMENWIYVEDFGNHMLLGECEAQAGMSGGGIFNPGGILLGLICGQDEKGMLAGLSTTVIEGEYQVFINN